LILLYHLYHVHHWGISDLRALYECKDGWQEIIMEFFAHEMETR